MIGAAVTLMVIALLFYGALAFGWWILLKIDREGIEPSNRIRQMDRDDGGRGPI